MNIATRVATKALYVASDLQYSAKFAQSGKSLLKAADGPGSTPMQIFSGVSDEYWLWLNTFGCRKHPELQAILPSMPSEEVQQRFTGMTGDYTMREAFSMYSICKRMIHKYVGAIDDIGDILDFGCGWGRIIRLFLKDVEPSKLMGVDCFDVVLEIARQTNRWCSFNLVPTMPPTELPDNTYGLIYLFSVFSHLSEDAQARWLVEFKRILRPGGLLIATTRSRHILLRGIELRKLKEVPAFEQGAVDAFPDPDQTLAAYERGEFCYSPTGGGDVLDGSFYGEAMVPRAYVEKHWTQHFTFLDFIDDRAQLVQNVIIARKE